MSTFQASVQELARKLDQLARRWSHEKEHEDFNDYVTAARNYCVQAGLTFTSLSRKFELDFVGGEGKRYQMKVTRNSVKMLEYV